MRRIARTLTYTHTHIHNPLYTITIKLSPRLLFRRCACERSHSIISSSTSSHSSSSQRRMNSATVLRQSVSVCVCPGSRACEYVYGCVRQKGVCVRVQERVGRSGKDPLTHFPTFHLTQTAFGWRSCAGSHTHEPTPDRLHAVCVSACV